MPWRHHITLIALALLTVLGGGSDSEAQDAPTKVTAQVLTNRVAVGEFGELIIRFPSGDGTVPKRIPSPDLEIIHSGTRSSVYVENGRQAVSTSHYFRFRGNKAGTFEIPAVTVRYENEQISTNAIPVEIFEQDTSDEAVEATKPFFGRLEVRKNTFYVNQIIPVSVSAFVRGRNSILDVVSSELADESFIVKPFRSAKMDGSDLGNFYYTSAVTPSTFFALKPGTYRLGPAMMRVRSIDASSSFGFSSLFPRTVVREIATNSIEVVAKALPANAPASFTGGVGDFAMSVVPSTTEVSVGDPISMEFTVTGVGNLRTMSAPVFAIPQTDIWKTYEPSKTLNDEEDSDGFAEGKASYSQVIIPEAKVDAIPSFELTFFDPALEQYVTRTSAPIPIRVLARAAGQQAAPITFANPSAGGTTPTRAAQPTATFDDILYIRTGAPKWLAMSDLVGNGVWFAAVQAILSVAFFTIVGFGVARIVKTARLDRNGRERVLTFEQSLKKIPKVGSSRRDFYHSVATALMLWKKEHPSAPPEVRAIVDRITDRCEAVLYGGKTHLEGLVAHDEATELESTLKKLPRK